MFEEDRVHSVDRAASLLIAIGDSQGAVGVSELGRRLGFNKSTASRLLATLQRRGLVERVPASGKYRLGFAVVRLGAHAERSLDIRQIARPQLRSLALAVEEAATLEILQGDSAVTTACSADRGAGRDTTGRYSPLHATAAGKVLLAGQPEREVIRLSTGGLTRYTFHTIVGVDQLLEALARVRQRGFATSFGEHEPLVNAVAVPVFNHRAAVVAAIELRGPGTRIAPGRMQELVERARGAAAAVTAGMGGVTPSP